MIKNSFSIENILSKPHKNLPVDNQSNSVSGTPECLESANSLEEVSSPTSNDVIFKMEPTNGLTTDDCKVDRSYTSPDSSGCEEDNVDNLSDITTGDSRKHNILFRYEWIWNEAMRQCCYQIQ